MVENLNKDYEQNRDEQDRRRKARSAAVRADLASHLAAELHDDVSIYEWDGNICLSGVYNRFRGRTFKPGKDGQFNWPAILTAVATIQKYYSDCKVQVEKAIAEQDKARAFLATLGVLNKDVVAWTTGGRFVFKFCVENEEEVTKVIGALRAAGIKLV